MRPSLWGAPTLEMCVIVNSKLHTDVLQVTYTMPACHPTYQITDDPRLNHTAEFALETGKHEAHESTWRGATAMASVGLRFLSDTHFANEVSDPIKGMSRG
jgi:hypothetical protein